MRDKNSELLWVGAIIRDSANVVLVNEVADEAADGRWGIPGGTVEPGELLSEALVREVREETGLKVLQIERLAYVSQHRSYEHPGSVLVFVYEVSCDVGTLESNDPDDLVNSVEFVPVETAIRLIGQFPRKPITEPLIDYLSHRCSTDVSNWFWETVSSELETVHKFP